MIQAFCQAPEPLQTRLGAGSYRPAGEDSAYLSLPSAHGKERCFPCSRAPAGQRLSDTAATMHPHRAPAFLTCSPAPFLVPAVMLHRPFARTTQLPKLEIDYWFGGGGSPLHCILLVQRTESVYRGGRGWLGWGEGSHSPGEKQRRARKADLLVLLALFYHPSVPLELEGVRYQRIC